MSSAATRVYRPSLSEHEITAVIEVLKYQNHTNGLDLLAKAAMVKFQKIAIDFEHNTKTPAYIATGVKKQSSVNLTALGATPEELILAKLSATELNEIKLEFYDYQATYRIDLPLSRFIGKTSEEVRMEELAALDRKQITDVSFKESSNNKGGNNKGGKEGTIPEVDSNKDDLDNMFGSDSNYAIKGD